MNAESLIKEVKLLTTHAAIMAAVHCVKKTESISLETSDRL